MGKDTTVRPDITNDIGTIPKDKLPIEFDKLPVLISVKALEPYYSRHSILAMFHQPGFPYVQIGKAFYTPKNLFIKWIEKQSQTDNHCISKPIS